jgi:hypothetical protein
MILELLIFSGRPNPSWRTTAEESAQIVRLIAYGSLVPAAPPRIALGYGGFSLRNFEAGEGDGRTSEIRVRDGVIAIAASGITRYCADVAGLEAYLLNTARIRRAIPVGIDPRRYG